MSKIYEKGRSMVEMLGVLAIIGVLSVGGIYGYTVAMRSNRINEIAHALSMLNTMGQALNNAQGDGRLGYNDVFSDLPDGVELLQYDNHNIKVKMEEQDDCLLLTNKMGDAIQVVSPCALAQVTFQFKNSGSNGTASGGSSGNNGNYEVVTTEPSGACTAGSKPRCYGNRIYLCPNGVWTGPGEVCV